MTNGREANFNHRRFQRTRRRGVFSQCANSLDKSLAMHRDLHDVGDAGSMGFDRSESFQAATQFSALNHCCWCRCCLAEVWTEPRMSRSSVCIIYRGGLFSGTATCKALYAGRAPRFKWDKKRPGSCRPIAILFLNQPPPSRSVSRPVDSIVRGRHAADGGGESVGQRKYMHLPEQVAKLQLVGFRPSSPNPRTCFH
jgi:hypothetical protein